MEVTPERMGHRRVAEVTLRVEVLRRGRDRPDEAVPVDHAHMNAPPSAMNVWPVR